MRGTWEAIITNIHGNRGLSAAAKTGTAPPKSPDGPEEKWGSARRTRHRPISVGNQNQKTAHMARARFVRLSWPRAERLLPVLFWVSMCL